MLLSLIERLVLLLIAVSVIRSVVRFVQGITSRFGTHISTRANHSPHAGSKPGSQGTSPATMLQQDPVCGTYVAIDASLKRVVNGKVLHFCSDDCRDRYRG
jgi:YHS domain-containing protein